MGPRTRLSAIDVSAWDVDWYLWSAYKVYGPHVGVMYGKRQAYELLLERGGQGPNHYFVLASDLTYKFELGGANHEACAGGCVGGWVGGWVGGRVTDVARSAATAVRSLGGYTVNA